MKLFTTPQLAFRRRRRRLTTGALAIAVTSGLLAAAGPAADASLVAPGNTAAITIGQARAGVAYQPVDPYPSSATTWGIDGPITDVNVDLNNLTFGRPADIDVLLVSPQGTAVMLMSSVCNYTQPVTNQYWTFDDEAAKQMPSSIQSTPACTSGSWKPSPYGLYSGTRLPAPAPLPSSQYPYYNRTLSAFRGENPNGTWRLFVHDRTNVHALPNGNPGYDPKDHGVILGGFRVIITTATRPVVVPADADGGGPASKYPLVQTVSGQNGPIREIFVYLQQPSHTYPDDLDVLLVAPSGQKIMLMSDACGGTDVPNGLTWRFNDRDPAMPDEGKCGPGGAGPNFAPTDHQPGESLPTPAPPGPYGTSLSALVGQSPNGEWRLFVADDRNADSGYLQGFSVSFSLAPPADLDVTAPDSAITEHPDSRTKSRRAKFTFTATEVGSTFECRIDNRAWGSCASPKSYARLTTGRHQFQVRATDKAGNRDATPATWGWRIRR